MRVIKIEKSLSPKLVGGSLPDIDADFAGRDRASVKSYVRERFGDEQVCSVGTFTTMKLRGLVKDLSRVFSIDYGEANLMTDIIDFKDDTFLDLCKRAVSEPRLKSFIKYNSEMFYMMPTLLNQAKVKSIHPCAMIIFPSIMKAQEWCPVRKQQGMIVSEWVGEEMDNAGFLKEDILVISQLDKFEDIIDLIKRNKKKVPDIYNLPHDDEVYRYFSNGWNGDVFQLGTSGLTEYTRALKPRSINDLIAAVAVFRPGPMENMYHEIYVQCKNRGRNPQYLWGTEEITKDTYGILLYQEQIMQVCQQIGGLSMGEADDIRRAMGKKKLGEALKWKNKVQQGFISKGCPQSTFDEVWGVMLEFAKYSFNKAHSAACAKTGYISQYLKVNYPIEYWTVALDYADENKALSFLSEITSAKRISIKSPDINESNIHMTSNQSSSQIFWGIGSIKGIGDAVATQIIAERKSGGRYKDFEDFYDRHKFKGSKVRKGTYETLISSGCFDSLHGIEGEEQKRGSLLKQYREVGNVKITAPSKDIYADEMSRKLWWWQLHQKQLTGLAFIDYYQIILDNAIETPFCSQQEFYSPHERGLVRSFGGYVVDIKIGRGKNGQYARMTLEHNYRIFNLLVWSAEFRKYKKVFKGIERRLVIFDGVIRFDAKWSKSNQFTLRSASTFVVL